MNGFGGLNGGDGMKGKTAVGDIQNEAAVFGTHADISDLYEFRSRSLTPVGRRDWGFAHSHSWTYFLLGSVSLFIFLRQRSRTHFTRRVRPALPCPLSCGKFGSSNAKKKGLPQKYIGTISERRDSSGSERVRPRGNASKIPGGCRLGPAGIVGR